MTKDNLISHKKVFVIHGHDEDNLARLKWLLRERFKLVPVVLKDEPDLSGTVIEHFERLAEQCCFAVVLLTPDDHVESPTTLNHRASETGVRQPRANVMFELGWFCGRLGRKVILFLCKEGTHLHSDFSGVLQKVFRKWVDEPHLIDQMASELRAREIIESGLESNSGGAA